jgi:AraC-like DNA-binding protein
MAGGVRLRWLTTVVSQHQIIAGLATARARQFGSLCSDMYARLPPPKNRVEDLLLRYMAIQAVLTSQQNADCVLGLMRAIREESWPVIIKALRSLDGSCTEATEWKAKRYIQSHFRRSSCRLSELSLALGASTRTITGRFNATFHCSVHRFVVLVRTSEALRQMVTTDEKISAIAVSSGFGSASSLQRALRRFGVQTSQRRRLDRAEVIRVLTKIHSELRGVSSPMERREHDDPPVRKPVGFGG